MPSKESVRLLIEQINRAGDRISGTMRQIGEAKERKKRRTEDIRMWMKDLEFRIANAEKNRTLKEEEIGLAEDRLEIAKQDLEEKRLMGELERARKEMELAHLPEEYELGAERQKAQTKYYGALTEQARGGKGKEGGYSEKELESYRKRVADLWRERPTKQLLGTEKKSYEFNPLNPYDEYKVFKRAGGDMDLHIAAFGRPPFVPRPKTTGESEFPAEGSAEPSAVGLGGAGGSPSQEPPVEAAPAAGQPGAQPGQAPAAPATPAAPAAPASQPPQTPQSVPQASRQGAPSNGVTPDFLNSAILKFTPGPAGMAEIGAANAGVPGAPQSMAPSQKTGVVYDPTYQDAIQTAFNRDSLTYLSPAKVADFYHVSIEDVEDYIRRLTDANAAKQPAGVYSSSREKAAKATY